VTDRLDPEVRAMIEQLKIQLCDNLHGHSYLDSDSGEPFWSKKMVEDAITASIPRTGVDEFEMGEMYQPTYEQYVEHTRKNLDTARDHLEYVAVYDPDGWRCALEEFEKRVLSYRYAVGAMYRHGPNEKVSGMVMGDLKIQPVTPADFVEITLVLDGTK